MISFIFQVTPERVRLLMSVDTTCKHRCFPYSIDTVSIVAIDKFEATEKAESIRKERLAFMDRIADNPINGIGQRG